MILCCLQKRLKTSHLNTQITLIYSHTALDDLVATFPALLP